MASDILLNSPIPTPTKYRPFPNPIKGESLCAPLGPGLYNLRRISTKKPVLFGIGSNCAARMCSLYPRPLGATGRNNERKRNYIKRHINDIEYATIAFKTRQDAADYERDIKREKAHLYTFDT
jgi:hypothetical protein